VPAAGLQALDAVDARTADTAAAVTALVAEVGCESVDQLRIELGIAREQRRVTAAAVDQAERDAKQAEALDEILRVARPFAANLEVLAIALRDQHFIAHLVDARESELLAEASRRLKAITKGRFGFVADFGVVSIASGEVRSADTLSGGERFQAALALALALVEIASRGGGRLDAVFIDEGFGSLDSNALDVALDTLGLVSGDGKMVALISHLRPVAEYVDTVLHVTKDDTLGSRIALLDAESRDRMLADDTESGLTV
jgi:exonuclease SbcC